MISGTPSINASEVILIRLMMSLKSGSNAKSDDSDKKASSESKSDDKKDSGKKVTVVTSGTGEPYSLISDDGKRTGIYSVMWDEIEKRTGWEVEVKQASFDAMWGELDTGRADVVANCLAVKEERTDKYNATILPSFRSFIPTALSS